MAKGFKDEIESIQKKIEPIYRNINQNKKENYIENSLKEKFNKINEELNERSELYYRLGEHYSLYSDDGLYYAYKKDLVIFEGSLNEDIILFYNMVIFGSKMLETYYKLVRQDKRNPGNIIELENNFKYCIIQIQDACPEILKKLTDTIEDTV